MEMWPLSGVKQACTLKKLLDFLLRKWDNYSLHLLPSCYLSSWCIVLVTHQGVWLFKPKPIFLTQNWSGGYSGIWNTTYKKVKVLWISFFFSCHYEKYLSYIGRWVFSIIALFLIGPMYKNICHLGTGYLLIGTSVFKLFVTPLTVSQQPQCLGSKRESAVFVHAPIVWLQH